MTNNTTNNTDIEQKDLNYAEILMNLPVWSNLDRAVAILLGRYNGQDLVSSNNANVDYNKLPFEAIVLGLALQYSFSLGNVCLKGKVAIQKIIEEVFEKSLSILSRDKIANEDIINLLTDKDSNFYQKVSQAIDSLEDIRVIQNIKAVEIIAENEEVSKEVVKPVIYNRNSFYISRCYNYETIISNIVKERLNSGANNIFSIESVSESKVSEYLQKLYESQNIKNIDPNPQNKELAVNWQKVAVAMSLLYDISFICGGPGTGKTTTVAKLIAILRKIYDDMHKELHIVMAAPTGKAATRMDESLNNSFNDDKYFIPDVAKLFEGQDIPNFRQNIDSTSTIHKLLGVRPGHTYSKVNQNNQITADVLIIDEASMIDVAMMAKLLEGTSKDTKIIFLGDKDQLSSVEAGSILGDICSCIRDKNNQRSCQLTEDELQQLSNLSGENVDNLKLGGLAKGISQLIVSNRFDDKSSIGVLAKKVNDGNVSAESFTSINTNLAEVIKANLEDNDPSKHRLYPLNFGTYDKEKEFVKTIESFIKKDIAVENKDLPKIEFPSYSAYTKYITTVLTPSNNPSLKDISFDEDTTDGQSQLKQLFNTLDKFRILGANHEGILGVDNINEILDKKLYNIICHSLEKTEFGKTKLDDISKQWFPGKVFMVTKNEKEIGIYNGDIVICGYSKNHGDSHRVFFKSNNNKIRSIGAHMLSSPDLGYALTIHKSQGSEFEHTMLVFQEKLGANITKELVYTGITRAKKYLSIYHKDTEQLAAQCNQVVERTSNLSERIFGDNNK